MPIAGTNLRLDSREGYDKITQVEKVTSPYFSDGTSTLTGTESGATSDTEYSFTIRATDAEGQTADRAFTITITFGAANSIQFN